MPNDENMLTGNTLLELAHDFTIVREGAVQECPTLDRAIDRCMQWAVGLHGLPDISPTHVHPEHLLRRLTVSVAELDESYPQHNVSEGYQLMVPADGSSASLTAQTIWGALHGLESFSQLIMFNFSRKVYNIPNAPWRIIDKPRFPHRGLMIDVVRGRFSPALHTLKLHVVSLSAQPSFVVLARFSC